MHSLENELEALIDKHGLENIVSMLAIICDLKAEHIRSNWQDSVSAKHWQRNAKTLDTATAKIRG